MKYVLLFLLFVPSFCFAGDFQNQAGFGGVARLSDAEGSQVKGKGYVYVYGSSSTWTWGSYATHGYSAVGNHRAVGTSFSHSFSYGPGYTLYGNVYAGGGSSAWAR